MVGFDCVELVELVCWLLVVYGCVMLLFGWEVDYYVDLCCVILYYWVFVLIGWLMCEFIVDWDYLVVGGLIFGVDFVVIVIMYVLGCLIDVFVVCKLVKVYGM